MNFRSITVSAAATLVLGLTIPSTATLAQTLQVIEPSRESLCPHPIKTLSLAATATPSLNAQDFSNPLPAGQGVRPLGGAGSNQVFRYTFNWKVPDKMCCEITKAVLVAHVRWNGPAGPSTAGNDTISIVHNNASVPGNGGYIWGANLSTQYNGAAPPNPLTKTITIPLNPAALAIANQGNHVSFSVQDDTTVESATLEISGCCVNH
jgi:hypothetical protein